MPCFHPIRAYQTTDGSVFFRQVPDSAALELACGQCHGCRLERARDWAVRCVHEARCHEHNCFLTLTFEHDPVSLVYKDFQDFMKRLRKRAGRRARVRFFMSGEYGSKKKRPHFHSLLFGLDFYDRKYWRTSESGSRCDRSSVLEELWPFGHSEVGELTYESAAYVARYVCDKVTGDPASRHYAYGFDTVTGEILERVPEFSHMSLRRPGGRPGGIGAEFLERFESDVWPRGHVVINGQVQGLPKYYVQLLKKKYGHTDEWARFELRRLEAMRLAYPHSSMERLAVREQVSLARLTQLKRSI